jgi:ZIP family zinc transporter
VGASLAWGLIAGSSLVLGGVIALRVRIHRLVLGLVMAFGAGVLLSAVAFELVEEAFDQSGLLRDVALGLFAGCAVFSLGDLVIDRLGGGNRKRIDTSQADGGSPLAIVLGIVLDGIPESAVIGLTVLTGGSVSVAMLVAVFLSNLPEAIAATSGLTAIGWRGSRVLVLWVAVTAVSGLAALAGYALFDTASPSVVAFVLAFAGGAILTMLADTMMPEAFAHGGRLAGVLTTVGFATAFAVSAFE